MRTFEKARGELMDEIWTLRASGVDARPICFQFDVCEDSQTVMILVELACGETLFRNFDLPEKVDPDNWNPSRYLDAMDFDGKATVH